MKTLDTPYDELSRIVNEYYKKNGDIRETMKETELPFDIVWDMTGHKDVYDWVD